MKRLIDKIKTKFSSQDMDEIEEEEYVEVTPEIASKSAKISVRSFVLDHYDDVKQILDTLREGYTISLVNIRPLKDKDLVELKRAVNRIKKTCEAVDGDIAGFGNDWIAVTPSFATIYRGEEADTFEEVQRF